MGAVEQIQNAGAVFEDLRELARVVEIEDVVKHPNADALELALIGGWQCCVKLGEFRKGDLAIYCEIDSMLPISNPMFAFLEERKEGLKQIGDKVYSRIKTIRLRKELSQGLLIPLGDLKGQVRVGDNLTTRLGVLKYDRPASAPEGAIQPNRSLLDRLCFWIAGGEPRSNLFAWPYFLPKSEQVRVQNIHNAYMRAVEADEDFEVTCKLDGASMTVWYKPADHDEPHQFGVCSRNLSISLKDDVWGPIEQARRWLANLLIFNRRVLKIKRWIWPRWKKGNLAADDMYVKMALDLVLEARLHKYFVETGQALALQGELCGPGIQDNFEDLPTKKFFVYKVFVDNGNRVFQEATPKEARYHVKQLGLDYVPVLGENAQLPATVQECLLLADGKPAFKSKGYREGLVFKSNIRQFSFKAISNSYLLKTDG